MVRRGAAWGLALLLTLPAWAHDAGHGPTSQSTSQPVPQPAQTGAAPWAARQATAKPLAVSAAFDMQGRLWLARVEDRHLWVAVSEDGGAHFSPATRATPAPEAIAAEGENRPKIAVAADGTVHLSWTVALAKPYTGHVRYSRSRDGGKTYSRPVTVNDDGAEVSHPEVGHPDVSHRFETLLVHGDRVVLAWLDGRERQAGGKSAGAALYYAVSEDAGAHFAPNRRAAASTCECCRVALAWQGEQTVALWRHLYPDNIRDFALAPLDAAPPPRRVSDDQWQLAGCPHHGGALAADDAGGLHLAWYTQGKARQGLFYRRLEGDAMTAPMKFGDDAAQAGHPAVLTQGSLVVLAWREFDLGDGQAYSVWTRQSQDRGATWSVPRRVATSAGGADYPLLVGGTGPGRLVWNSEREGLRVFPLETTPPQPFTTDTPAALRTQYAGRPYILAFWSLECGHCQAELQTFAQWRQRRPDLPLVLVASDAPEHADAVARRLAELGLEGADSRLFADPMPERIRYAVDRTWRGELPRTYLFDAAHRATPVSGALDEATLAAWIAAHLDELNSAAARGKGTP